MRGRRQSDRTRARSFFDDLHTTTPGRSGYIVPESSPQAVPIDLSRWRRCKLSRRLQSSGISTYCVFSPIRSLRGALRGHLEDRDTTARRQRRKITRPQRLHRPPPVQRHRHLRKRGIGRKWCIRVAASIGGIREQVGSPCGNCCCCSLQA